MFRLSKLLPGAVAGLLAVGLAPAHAQVPAQTGAQQPAYAPIMLVLDGSGSMKQADATGTKMDAAKSALRRFIGSAPAEAQVGLTVYGTRTGSSDAEKAQGCQDVQVLSPPNTIDKPALTAAVDGIQPSGYTPIGTALRTAAAALPQTGPRAVVLVSDGEGPVRGRQGTDRPGRQGRRARGRLRRRRQVPRAAHLHRPGHRRHLQRRPRRQDPGAHPAARVRHRAAHLRARGHPDHRRRELGHRAGRRLRPAPGHPRPEGNPLLRGRRPAGRHRLLQRHDLLPPPARRRPARRHQLAPAARLRRGRRGLPRLAVRAGGHVQRRRRPHDRQGLGRRDRAEEGQRQLRQLPRHRAVLLRPDLGPRVGRGARAAAGRTARRRRARGRRRPLQGRPAHHRVHRTRRHRHARYRRRLVQRRRPTDGQRPLHRHLQRGEYVFYRVKLAWGQGLAYRVHFGQAGGSGVDNVSNIATTAYNPYRAEIDSDTTVYTGSGGVLPTRDAIATAPVRYHNREADNSKVRTQAVAGWYYIAVKLGATFDEGDNVPVPVTLDLTVAGTPEPGPAYTAPSGGVFGDDQPTETAEPTPVAAATGEGAPVWPFWVGGAGVVVVAAIIVLAVRDRRS